MHRRRQLQTREQRAANERPQEDIPEVPEPTSLIEETKEAPKDNAAQPTKLDEPTKDIFKVSEFDVLRELGDDEPESIFGIEEPKPMKKRPKKSEVAIEEDDDDESDESFEEFMAAKDSKRKAKDQSKMEHLEAMMQAILQQQTTNSGSVAYGLPTVALTRRTLDVQIKAKQIEMINDKLIRIMRRP